MWAWSTNPTSPRRPLPDVTYRRLGELAVAQGAALDALGVPFGGRVAMVSHNAARLAVSFFGVSGNGRVFVPINFRLSRDEVAYIVEHCGADVLLVDPEIDDALSERLVRAPLRDRRGERRGDVPVRRRAEALAARRRRDRDHQLHVGHDRAAEGRRADASRAVAQFGDLRLAARCQRS